MTVTRGLALILTVATAGAFVNAAAPPDTRASVRLTAISARVGSKGASLIIEASEPVAYTTSRPDPLTVLLDFRNVGGQEVANSVAADVKSPIARVSVETVESLGAPASRVRIALSQPVVHHVRSERNTVVVDFERPSAKAAPYVLPPATRRTSGEPTAPDAMQALHETPSQDPIAALGLDNAVGGPSAVSSPGVTSQPVSQPKVVQSAGAMAAQLAAAQATTPQPPAPPAPQTDQPGAGSRGRQFTGHPISLDFQGADLRAVLRTFAEISGLNIVIDPAVQGTVDVALRDVPWDQALDIILRANKLGYSVDGTIVRIAPNTVLKLEEDERKALVDSQNDASQLGTLQRQLSYAKGEEVAQLLKSANVLTQAWAGERRSADQHADRPRYPEPVPRDHDAHRRHRSRAAASRDRSAHRADQQDLRARARRAVGLRRARGSVARQHDEPGVSQQREPHGPRRSDPGARNRMPRRISRPPSTSLLPVRRVRSASRSVR